MKQFIYLMMYLFFPNRCEKCFSPSNKWVGTVFVEGYGYGEEECVCNKCGAIHNYWAYGCFEVPRDVPLKERIEFMQRTLL